MISPASETLQKRYGEDEDTDSRMAQHIADHATNPLEETKEGFEGLTNGAKLKNELKSMSKQR